MPRRRWRLSSSARRERALRRVDPDKISLSRDEAKVALDPAMEDAADAVRARIEEAARIIVDKLLPDLSDL
jgi:hypothetical protein